MNKKSDIKSRTCYYFDDIMRVRDIDFSVFLLDEKSYKTYKNILIYDISYKSFMGSIALRIRFDEIDGFIKIYDRVRYLVFFGRRWYDEICDGMKYLISVKSGITDSINHNFARIGIASYNSLPIEKIFLFHNVIILIKLVSNKDNFFRVKINPIHNIFK